MVQPLPTIVWIQGGVRPLPRANQVCCQSQARAVGLESAQQLQVVEGRKAKSYDNEAHSRARVSWIRMGDVKCCLLLGTNSLNNFASSRRCNSVTAWCHASILSTPSSGCGFRSNAATSGCTRKESQVPWQRSVFWCSRVSHSNGQQPEVFTTATNARIQGGARVADIQFAAERIRGVSRFEVRNDLILGPHGGSGFALSRYRSRGCRCRKIDWIQLLHMSHI